MLLYMHRVTKAMLGSELTVISQQTMQDTAPKRWYTCSVHTYVLSTEAYPLYRNC
jgi:hypothetical protein